MAAGATKISIISFKGWTLLVLGVILLASDAFSEEKSGRAFSTYSLAADVHYGFLIPHHSEMWGLTDGYFPSYELSIIKQTNGTRSWQYLYHYPQIGLACRYSDFGGSGYLGKSYSLVSFIVFSIVKHEKFQLGFKAGLGLGYMTKKFHRLGNYKNLVIGSYLNAAISFELKSKIRLSDRLFFDAGLSMMHVSNGTIKTPNFGLNIPAVFGGITYKLGSGPVQYFISDSIPDKKGKKNFRLMFWGATKQVERNWSDQFLVFVLTGDYSNYYNNRSRYLIGFDMIYDESVKYVLNRERTEISDNKETVKIGINVGHEVVLEKLSLYIALGVYVHTIDKTNGAIYDKIGVNYAITRHLILGVVLKAHYAQADYLCAGLGLNF